VFLAWQTPQPFIVVPIPPPAHQTSLADVILAALGLTGVLVIGSLVAGALVAVLLVMWNRRHPPEEDRLPSISPLVPDSTRHESSRAR